MPIYDFACSACQHRFERLQKMSDADPTICPQCGQQAVSRQVTAPSFRLAGSGWYETDFKKDSDKKKNLVDSKPASEKSTSEKPATTTTPVSAPSTKSE